MNILVVHQYYLLPGQPGGSRFNEFARIWAEAGHQVTVIAGNMNRATNWVPRDYQGRWVVREQDGPVTVYRCHVPQSYGKSFRGRMWAFFGFTMSAATAALRARRPDVVIATSPPLVVPIPGWLAAHAHLRGVPWIFEVRDLWPESAVTTGVLKEGATLTRLLYGLERLSCWSADRINVLTPAFREDLVNRGLASGEKIAFVPNGADVSLFSPGVRENDAREELGWGDRFVVMYAGAHGRANALMQLVEAAERLRHRPDILIACVGGGPERAFLSAEVAQRGLKNMRLHGPVPKARMPAVVRACDVGAAVLQRNPTFKTVYPNKVFDYMACERPTLLAIDGVARELVCDQARAGVFAEPEDPESIAGAILKLAEDSAGRTAMGRRGRAWVLRNATREALAKRYLEIMRVLVEEGE